MDNSTKKKCIFLYVNQGFAVRYLLRTDILKTLREGTEQIVIVSPNGDEPVFRKNFESENVRVEKFEHEACESYLKKKKLQRMLVLLRAFVLNGRYDTVTIDDYRKIFIAQNGWVKEHGLKNFLKGKLFDFGTYIFKNIKLLRRLLIRFETVFYAPRFHKELFEKYSPDLVVVTALCSFKHNEFFAREAHSFGVPVCCVMLSWDNSSGNGMPGYNADHIITWNEKMKKELIELNDIDGEKIFVGGVAHFDPYYKETTCLSREAFYDKMGLDHGKKTIFYATKSPKRFPWGPELVAELAKAIKNGKIKDSPQILVRIHPLHYRTKNGKVMFKDIIDEYHEVAKKYPCVILNTPETVSKKIDFDMADSETTLIASILKHSSVMLNMFSTMVIEASVFNLPTINICIRGKCKGDFGKTKQDIMIDFTQKHNQSLLESGGVRTVFSDEELYETINMYMDNPETDAEGRMIIVKNEAGPFRGNAGETIGRHIFRLAGI